MLSDMTGMLAQHVPTGPVYELQSYPAKYTLADVIAKQKPNLCLLDAGTNRERALQIVSEIAGIDASLSVLVLLDRNDPELVLNTMRQGAAGFLVAPFTPDQLLPALDRIVKQNPTLRAAMDNQSKVYLVMPAKGACGASTIAASLAYQWKKFGSKKSLLADLDPLTGTLSFLLKVKSTYSFVDVLSRAGNLDADLWKGMVSTIQGIDVLLSPETPANGVGDLHDPSTILQFARQIYDTVTVDCNGAYGDWSLNMARQCDELLLVTTNELPALQATQRSLSYLDHHRVDRSKIKLIVNRYNRDVGLSKEVIGTALHTEVFHLVPSDYDAVNRALMEGKPIPLSTAFGKSIGQLAEGLAGQNGKEESTSAPAKKTGSFISRLFGR